MDPKTKEELDKILDDIKKYKWDELTDKQKNEKVKKYYEKFRPIIEILEAKISELIKSNNTIELIALKDVLTKFISGKNGVSHALLEIAYRRSHNKY